MPLVISEINHSHYIRMVQTREPLRLSLELMIEVIRIAFFEFQDFQSNFFFRLGSSIYSMIDSAVASFPQKGDNPVFIAEYGSRREFIAEKICLLRRTLILEVSPVSRIGFSIYSSAPALTARLISSLNH